MEDLIWNELLQARLSSGAVQAREEIQNTDRLLQMDIDSFCPEAEVPFLAAAKAMPIPNALAWRLDECERDCSSFPSPSSAHRRSPDFAGSPISFFIPVPGTTASSTPSFSSSPSFGVYSVEAHPTLVGSPTSCHLQSLSLGNSSSSSSENSSTSSSCRRSLKRKLELRVGTPQLNSDWTDQRYSPGPVMPESSSRGAQEPGFEARGVRSGSITQYSWINEEASVKIFIPFSGIHDFPYSCINVAFGKESLDVVICDPAKGTQHKLAFKQLYGEIIPKECRFFQHTDKLVIKLIKAPGRMDAYNKGRPLEWFALKFS